MLLPGPYQAGDVGFQAVVADDLADLGHDLGVEGGSHNVLRGEGGGGQLALVVAQQAGGQTWGPFSSRVPGASTLLTGMVQWKASPIREFISSKVI